MQTQITVKRLTGAIGAEVKGVDLNRPLDDGTFATIRPLHVGVPRAVS
jgi:alpha-ketoglutarate-dependent taurine dioxygenase